MRPVVHFIAGRIGSGKSTLARTLARELTAVHICEDQWIALVGGEVRTLRDYVRYSTRCRALMGPHLSDVVRVGTSLVLDFAGNTPRDRAWVRGLFLPLGIEPVLHVLEVSEAVCLERLRRRNTERIPGQFWGEVSEALFHEAARYFAPPTPEEGLRVVWHGAGASRASES